MEEGKKFDQGKLRYDLVPVDSLEKLVEIYTFGAKKYADHNWRKGLVYSRIYAAIQRHLNLFWKGENLDKESNLEHIAHAAWGCFTLLNFCNENRVDLDDRFIKKDNIKKEILHEDEIGVTNKDAVGTVFKRKDKVQVYLAGTIHAVEYRKNFKEYVKEDDRIIVRDPIEEVDKNIDLKNPKDFSAHMKLVQDDKNMIKECDILVAYVQRYTAGTICEIIYAYENGIPVYLISNDNQVMNDPWIISHITFGFENIKDCINHIIDNDLEIKNRRMLMKYGGIEIFDAETQKTKEDKLIQFDNNQEKYYIESTILSNGDFFFKIDYDQINEIFKYILDNVKVPFYVVHKPAFRFKDTREIRELKTRIINSKEQVVEEFNKAKEIYFYSIMQYPDPEDIENKKRTLIRYYALCEEDLK